VLQRRDRPLILHLSAEYPDPLRDRTTPAVKGFIDRLPEFDHLIVSLKRFSDSRRSYMKEFDWRGNQKVVAIGYWAPPAGMLHRPRMRALARTIESIVEREPIRPVLTTAHKLTVEGVVAHELRRRIGLPYVCCARGEVETKFFRFKPGLRSLFGDVIREAEAIYYVSAWFRRWIEERYPGHVRAASLLPNFISSEFAPDFRPAPPDRLVTVMDLNVYRRKGLPELIEALALARKVNPALSLDVIGWSTPRLTAKAEALIAAADLRDWVRLEGFVDNAEVLRRLPSYAGFVLPSRNETFGMAYVEALLSGVPILYGRDTGIDGYLDGLDVGVAVTIGDVADLARGLLTLAARAHLMRRAIRANYADLRGRFSPKPYLSHYAEVVARIGADSPARFATVAG
jgi:glycosyltransferase involved in cell wall biosynthesis